MVDSQGAKKIVILGAGFAGLRVAQDLVKLLDEKHEIFLVDRNSGHLYAADLYEVAAAFTKGIHSSTLMRLRESVVTKFKDLLGSEVRFIHGEVLKINPKKRRVSLKSRELGYDYLVLALGAENAYYGIDGLEKYSFPLKTVQDALKLNYALDEMFKKRWKKQGAKNLNIVIGGGGATGVELAGELAFLLKKFAKKYGVPEEGINLHLVEMQGVLGGFKTKGTKYILRRFKKLGVNVYLKHKILKLTSRKVFLDGEVESLSCDMLLWTGGVKVNPLVGDSFPVARGKRGLPVNKYLRARDYADVFAAGDNALWGRSGLPWLAKNAYEQGGVVAENVAALIDGRKMSVYVPRKETIVVPVGSRYAVWKFKGMIFQGRWVWFLKRLVALKYYCSILPLWKALPKWWRSNEIFLRND